MQTHSRCELLSLHLQRIGVELCGGTGRRVSTRAGEDEDRQTQGHRLHTRRVPPPSAGRESTRDAHRRTWVWDDA